MKEFKDNNGKDSMMRKISWAIVLTGLIWGTFEVAAHLILLKHGINFDIHETLILTTVSIGVAGKGTQKAIEVLNKNKTN